jgi:hypothetical protein
MLRRVEGPLAIRSQGFRNANPFERGRRGGGVAIVGERFHRREV